MEKKESVLLYAFPGTAVQLDAVPDKNVMVFIHPENFKYLLEDSYPCESCDVDRFMYDEFGNKIQNPEWPSNLIKYIDLIAREQQYPPKYIIIPSFIVDDETKEFSLAPYLDELGKKDYTSFTLVPMSNDETKEMFIRRLKAISSPKWVIDYIDSNWVDIIDKLTKWSCNCENFSNMMSLIRPAGKIQTVYDIINNNIGIAMEFDD